MASDVQALYEAMMGGSPEARQQMADLLLERADANLIASVLGAAMQSPRNVGEPRREAWLPITGELLRELLHFPSAATITGARMSPRSYSTVELLLHHPDLREVLPGEDTPNVTAQWHRQDEVVFDGWVQ